MEDKVIGEGSVGLHDVVVTIEKCTSAFAHLQRNWRSFAQYLRVNESEIPGLELKVTTGILQLKDVPGEVIKKWKAETGSTATLKTLCEALNDCGVREVADALQRAFSQPEPTRSNKFLLNGKERTLEELVGDEACEDMFRSISKKRKISDSIHAIPLIKPETSPPDQPSCYMARKFIFRTKLNEAIFTADSTKEHVFLVKGATKPELARACKHQLIESSRKQLDGITVRFIMLELEDDFEQISKITSKPVHLIEYFNKDFFWLKSTHGLDTIRKFLKIETKTDSLDNDHTDDESSVIEQKH